MKGFAPVWWAHLRCIDKDDDAHCPEKKNRKRKYYHPFIKTVDTVILNIRNPRITSIFLIEK